MAKQKGKKADYYIDGEPKKFSNYKPVKEHKHNCWNLREKKTTISGSTEFITYDCKTCGKIMKSVEKEIKPRTKRIYVKGEITNDSFAKEYATGKLSGKPMNARVAYHSLRPQVKLTTASHRGSQLLKKPEVRQKISEIHKQIGWTEKDRALILKRNAQQDASFSASNQAIEISLKNEAGFYSKEAGGGNTINIGILLDKIPEYEAKLNEENE